MAGQTLRSFQRGKHSSWRIAATAFAGSLLFKFSSDCCFFRFLRRFTAATAVQHRRLDERFACAPMMAYTDEHFRSLLRMLTRHAALYTEMVASRALERGVPEEWVFDRGGQSSQGPLVLQLGGPDASSLAQAAEKSMLWPYDGINLNCGCPSLSVAGSGSFGAAMMREAANVARCCEAMAKATSHQLPISVKCRTGVLDTPGDLQHDVDDERTFQQLCDFVRVVSECDAGVTRFVIHARKAVLSGLDPKANREVPPLRHDLVVRVAEAFPELSITINGGIADVASAVKLLNEHNAINGVMCGRAVVRRPWEFAVIDSQIYGKDDPALCRRKVLSDFSEYAEAVEKKLTEDPRFCAADDPERHQRHTRFSLLGAVKNLFVGEPCGRRYRAAISEAEKAKGALGTSFTDLLSEAIKSLPATVLDAAPAESLSRTSY